MKVIFAATLLLAVMGSALAQTKVFKPTVSQAADAAGLVAFASAVKDGGLAPALDNATLVATVFAPSDEAFKALADSTDEEVQAILADKDSMAKVLKYHVVPGAAVTGDRLVKLIEGNKGVFPFTTLAGEKLNATLVDGSVAINGVPVKAIDSQGGKVIIHTLGDVLVPPSMAPKPAKKAAAGAAAPAADGSVPAPTDGAASVAASLMLALPLVAAALL